jgi:hypothetical protein
MRRFNREPFYKDGRIRVGNIGDPGSSIFHNFSGSFSGWDFKVGMGSTSPLETPSRGLAAKN